jgi:hypothetical protein
MSSGFSVSFLNQNKWKNLQTISELDTFAFDTTLDDTISRFYSLDTTINLSQHENYLTSGRITAYGTIYVTG